MENLKTKLPKEIKYGFYGVVTIFSIIFLWSSFYTVKDGTVGVVSTLGKFDDDESLPGIHFKIPLIQSVDIKDIKMQTVNYRGGTQSEDTDPTDGVTQRPRVTILDSKNLPIGIDISVQYTPDASRMSDILRDYGHNYFDKKINPIVRDVVRDVASGYEAETISSKRSEIGSSMKAKLTESFTGTPFILNEVALRDLVLPPVVQKKVEAVQEAKQEEQRLAMVEKQALVNKNIAIINAEKAAQEKVIAAQAEADAIKVKSIEQAAANKRLTASLSSILVQQNWVEKWNGTQPQYMLGSDANMLMSIK